MSGAVGSLDDAPVRGSRSASGGSRKGVIGLVAGLRRIKSNFMRTLFLLVVCGGVTFAILAARLYEIQIVSNDYYGGKALTQQYRSASTLTASRGTIYDTNGKILAMSASVDNVFISPFEVEKYEEDVELIATELSAILSIERDVILEKAAKTPSQYQILKYKVEGEEADRVREFIKENKIKSVHLEATSKRYYPNSSLASQIIGFTGFDGEGLEGIEHRYNDYLSGTNGRVVRLKNAKGTEMLLRDYEDYYAARDGADITLTIDSTMQYYVEKHLEKAIEDYKIQNGAACIVMNAKTGAILANANYPNYDPNNYLALSSYQLDILSLIEDEDEYKKAYTDAQFRQWRNRSFSDTYEPGSVFKIITLAMALEERAATLDSTYYCSGTMDTILARKEPLRCWRTYGHGNQTLCEAMQNSCNVATATIGIKVGAQNFYKYARAFGLFDKTRVDEPAEARSQWWSEKTFFDRTNQTQLTSASFGQTFKVTPIQMITAAAAAVNGGYLMQPYIVKQITDSDGNIILATEPTVVRQVISAETSEAVRSILEDVVKTGTGKNAQVMGYRVGGKTGTSENIEQLAQSGLTSGTPKDYIVSFLGFAPADDPEIIILLLMDTPSESNGITISGGAMAAPVVSSMLEDLLPLCFNLTPHYTEEDLKNINLNVPRLSGKPVADAKELLSELGFRGVVVGDGDTVTGQLPAPNAHVSSGTRVLLYAGQSTPKLTAIVPDLSGMTYLNAKQALEGDGMFIRTSGALRSDSKAKVSVQSIAPGVEVAYGTVIEVTLIDKDAVETRN